MNDDINELVEQLDPAEYEELITLLSHELDLKFGAAVENKETEAK